MLYNVHAQKVYALVLAYQAPLTSTAKRQQSTKVIICFLIVRGTCLQRRKRKGEFLIVLSTPSEGACIYISCWHDLMSPISTIVFTFDFWHSKTHPSSSSYSKGYMGRVLWSLRKENWWRRNSRCQAFQVRKWWCWCNKNWKGRSRMKPELDKSQMTYVPDHTLSAQWL